MLSTPDADERWLLHNLECISLDFAELEMIDLVIKLASTRLFSDKVAQIREVNLMLHPDANGFDFWHTTRIDYLKLIVPHTSVKYRGYRF